jgi:hypothetical protein
MLDLAYGSEAAVRCFRALAPVADELRRVPEGWLDDVWCEGAALVDRDRRVLLWFTDPSEEWVDQIVARDVLELTWPGWDVRWAFDGVGDLQEYLGLGREFTREPPSEEKPSGWWRPLDDGDAPRILLTGRQSDGVVGVWGSDQTVADQLIGGSGLLGVLNEHGGSGLLALDDMVEGGIHLDPTTRSVRVWSAAAVIGLHRWPWRGWEGWSLEFSGTDHSW